MIDANIHPYPQKISIPYCIIVSCSYRVLNSAKINLLSLFCCIDVYYPSIVLLSDQILNLLIYTIRRVVSYR